MKKYLLLLFALCGATFSAAAGEPAVQQPANEPANEPADELMDAPAERAAESAAAERWTLLAGADFDVYFDNREYTPMQLGESQTLFSARLSPFVGIGWGEQGRNRLMVKMDFRSDFGDDSKLFANIRPQLYYRFANRKVSAYAGIFSRDEMIGDYSELFISDSMRFYDNRVQGFMGQYRGKRGYVELSVDWCGMYSKVSREKFRVMSAGRYWFDSARRFYGGYAFSMLHFAGSEEIHNNVTDNLLLDPYVGARFRAWADFDVKLHYIVSFQHDRANESTFRRPMGGMFQLRMAKWGVFVDEQLYVGQNQQPFYATYRNEQFPNGYGAELYAGEPFFGTTEKIYNNLKIGYDRWFFRNTVGVKCFMSFRYDGTGWGNSQLVMLSLRLLKEIPLYRNR